MNRKTIFILSTLIAISPACADTPTAQVESCDAQCRVDLNAGRAYPDFDGKTFKIVSYSKEQ
jgi:uncharacterized membrane-anchored protein